MRTNVFAFCVLLASLAGGPDLAAAAPGSSGLMRALGLGGGAPNRIQIVVADNGSGIAPKDMADIFTPFFTTKERGTGLGLALARKVVVAHGGHIDITSQLG